MNQNDFTTIPGGQSELITQYKSPQTILLILDSKFIFCQHFIFCYLILKLGQGKSRSPILSSCVTNILVELCGIFCLCLGLVVVQLSHPYVGHAVCTQDHL